MLPPPWTWPVVVAALISIVSLGLSIATYVQWVRYHPQPKLVPDWGRGDIMPSAVHYAPSAHLLVMNVGDAAATDVKAYVSTWPEPNGVPRHEQSLVEPGKPFGWIEAPLTRQVEEGDLDDHGNIPLLITVPPEQLRYERPVVTITWRQAPFHRRPRKIRLKVPNHLMGPAEF